MYGLKVIKCYLINDGKFKMKQRAFFVYERSFSNEWKPTIYWEYPPQKGIETKREWTVPIELTDEHMLEDGTPDLPKIMILFPKPVE